MSEFTAEDVLLKAAGLVEAHWCKGQWFGEKATGFDLALTDECLVSESRLPDKVCLEGAIHLAAWQLTGDRDALEIPKYEGEAPKHALVAESMQRIRSVIPASEPSPWTWNDAEGRTADEVAEALRRAAE